MFVFWKQRRLACVFATGCSHQERYIPSELWSGVLRVGTHAAVHVSDVLAIMLYPYNLGAEVTPRNAMAAAN